MGFTGQLGTNQSQLANIVLGSLPSGGTGISNFLAHVLDSKTIRVLFDRPMASSALTPGVYTIASVGGPFFVPIISSVSFYDSVQRSVSINLVQSLQFGGVYTLSVIGTQAVDGALPTGNSYNFTATVPDPPRAIGAYLSLHGNIDIVFDRPVGKYSISATANIKDTNSSATASLTLVPWTITVPQNNIRFALPVSIPTTSSYQINFSSVQDISSNSSSGSISLSLTLRAPTPYNASTLQQIQIIDSFVDRVSNDYQNTAAIRVYFNCPVNGLQATTLSNWSVSQQGSHSKTDSVDLVSLPNPVTPTDLVNYANSLKNVFNNHIINPGVHVLDDNIPATNSDVIRLANDLKSKLNGHLLSTVEHVLKDSSNLITSPDATDLNSVVVLLNQIQLNYNTHRIQVGVHNLNELEYISLRPKAFDLQSAALLADELRIKINMHDANPNTHFVSGLFQSLVPFSLAQVIYENAVDVANAAGLLNEVYLKYSDHIPDGTVHVYPDFVNSLSLTQLLGATSAGATLAPYLSSSISFAVSLKTNFNKHLAANYPITISQVVNHASLSSSFDVISPNTYYCDVVVPAISLLPNFNITALLQSEDLLSITNTGTYTGSIVSRGMSGPPKILSASYSPQFFSIRTDREIVVPDSSSFNIASSVGPVQIKSVKVDSTPQTLFTLLTDLMNAYVGHLTLTGHPITDVINVPSMSDFPITSMVSVIGQANKFKKTFNFHASNGTFHNFSAPSPVLTPDATDTQSAITLIRSIRDNFISHNSNLGLHTTPGPIQVSAKASDSILLEVDGIIDGSVYTVIGSVTDVVTNLAGPNLSHQFQINTKFVGISAIPYLASALPQIALLPTSTPSNPLPSSPIRMGSDSIVCFFSRPMQKISALLTNVRVTGGILVKDSSWIDDRTLSNHITNMSSSTYQIDVSGFNDKQGNPLPPFTLAGP